MPINYIRHIHKELIMKFVQILLLLFVSYKISAQTGIGTTSPNASARLEVAATDKGFLLPRMTSAQRIAITSPANGLVVYQTDEVSGFYVNTGTDASPVWSRVNMDWVKSGNDIAYTAGNISTTGSISGGNSTSSSLSGFSANISSISNSYSLISSDNGKLIQSTGSAALTITIPAGLPTGFNCTLVQMGAGQITFSGTYFNRANFTKSASQYSVVSILHLGNNNIVVTGEMSN